MKIVITGDTHIANENKELPVNLIDACKAADLIVHTGDWNSMEVFSALSQFAEVKGVYGNIDSEEVMEQFPAQQLIEVNGFKIGVVHGHGEKKTTEKRAIEAFDGLEVDVIIFGHSHIPLIRYFKDTLLINPGSPTFKRKLPHFSYGVLEIKENIRAEIVFFNDYSKM
ncbi:metallophosphoesterase family protein [Virgibacillus flavescens]|uniref:metallophosphoesterase family protein n=1 Tax=Virgibacillus flavescens TaxID=1611422 RepID=UPI003D348A69